MKITHRKITNRVAIEFYLEGDAPGCLYLSPVNAAELGQYLVDEFGKNKAPQPLVDQNEAIDALQTIAADNICDISAMKGIIESQNGQIEDLKTWFRAVIENRDETILSLKQRLASIEIESLPKYRSELCRLKERIKEVNMETPVNDQLEMMQILIERQSRQIEELHHTITSEANEAGRLIATLSMRLSRVEEAPKELKAWLKEDFDNLHERLEKLENKEKIKEQIPQMRDISPAFDRWRYR